MKKIYTACMLVLGTGALFAATAGAHADEAAASNARWKNMQMKYVECVVSETDKRMDMSESHNATAQLAINRCDMQLYSLGVEYSRWLHANAMDATGAKKELTRFVAATRSDTRMSMMGNLAVMRSERQVLAHAAKQRPVVGLAGSAELVALGDTAR